MRRRRPGSSFADDLAYPTCLQGRSSARRTGVRNAGGTASCRRRRSSRCTSIRGCSTIRRSCSRARRMRRCAADHSPYTSHTSYEETAAPFRRLRCREGRMRAASFGYPHDGGGGSLSAGSKCFLPAHSASRRVHCCPERGCEHTESENLGATAADSFPKILLRPAAAGHHPGRHRLRHPAEGARHLQAQGCAPRPARGDCACPLRLSCGLPALPAGCNVRHGVCPRR